jgi:hypothetical protein
MPLSPRLLRPLSTGFDPRRIANCVGWFDAADAASLFQSHTGATAVTALNDPVGYITNKAASNHATQSTAGSRALFKPDAQNNRSTLLFDGSDDWYALGSSLQPDNSGGMTVFAAIKRSSNGGAILSERVTTRAAAFQMVFFSSDYFIASDGVNASSSSSISQANFDLTASFAVLTYTHVVGSRMGLRIDGSTISVLAGTQSSLSGSAGARIGRREGTLVTFYWNGEMGELIVYSRSVSAAERDATERYLLRKWGVV